MATYLKQQVYAVLPTPEDIVTLEARDARSMSLSVTNLDETQTVDVQVVARVWADDDAGALALADLTGIQPGETRPAHLVLGNHDSITLRAVASGAGCDVRVSARPDMGKHR